MAGRPNIRVLTTDLAAVMTAIPLIGEVIVWGGHFVFGWRVPWVLSPANIPLGLALLFASVLAAWAMWVWMLADSLKQAKCRGESDRLLWPRMLLMFRIGVPWIYYIGQFRPRLTAKTQGTR
jgi:hypothetical protein